jgi:Flp pilus assembly protein TadG
VAAVEFAIVAPVFLFLMFGMIAYGIFFGAVHSVQQLAANSARAAMGGLSFEERQSLVQQHIATTAEGDTLLHADYLSVSVEAVPDQTSFVQITIAYDASQLPIWNLYNGLPLPEKVITRSAVIRTGGY